ncbi:MAG: metallophosphoesterase [Deltaproteobacteria bacterium]|nr:metallophosphoesterase [Deltaproteobacteria bacterium]
MRVLFLSDTHLGFDLPMRPRVSMRRRGPDFFANYEMALERALEAGVDAVVHGGDLFYRSRIPHRLVDMAFAPLVRVAGAGVPVYLVPGNHEQSAIPRSLLASSPNIHVFDRPRTFVLEARGCTLALCGFPYEREGIRTSFRRVLERTGWRDVKADGHVLCMHHCVEGATVGPVGFTFRHGHDVVRADDIPAGLAAVLCGHVHRFQVLTKGLRAPVFYAGSIERTSFAEKGEMKGYLDLEIGYKVNRWSFHELPARPMVQLDLYVGGLRREEVRSWLELSLGRLPDESVVKIGVHGEVSAEAAPLLRAGALRALAPDMNVSLSFGRVDGVIRSGPRWRSPDGPRPA